MLLLSFGGAFLAGLGRAAPVLCSVHEKIPDR
jgi:hypothetical protein